MDCAAPARWFNIKWIFSWEFQLHLPVDSHEIVFNARRLRLMGLIVKWIVLIDMMIRATCHQFFWFYSLILPKWERYIGSQSRIIWHGYQFWVFFIDTNVEVFSKSSSYANRRRSGVAGPLQLSLFNVCPFDVVSSRRFSIRRFVFRHFVTQHSCSKFKSGCIYLVITKLIPFAV